MRRTRLAPAYHGYHHQDVIAAYAFAAILLQSDGYSVTVEQKAVTGDRFDDLEISGPQRKRIQVKSHQTGSRLLRLSDFTTSAIDFRIDDAVRSFTEDQNPAHEYRLLTTYGPPADDLLPFVRPDSSVPPLLPGLQTERFRLNPDRIWPEGKQPQWLPLAGLQRQAFAEFCERFVVEVRCPPSSGDLRAPGPLEQALLAFLDNRIGVGHWPNHNRNVTDAAALLVTVARAARATSATLGQHDVIAALDLKVDYGRVEERLPVDEQRLVQRDEALDEIIALLRETNRLTLTGSPGVGKSYLLHMLADRLRKDGWLVATHYCFVDLLDSERALRASMRTIYGSLIAELKDRDPSLDPDTVPKFAAGSRELEGLLESAVQTNPERRIAIIVDGVDHADRLPEPERRGTASAAEIAEELALLNLPPGVSLITGSQPGKHLKAFLDVGREYRVGRWTDEAIRVLVGRLDLATRLREQGLKEDVPRIFDVIVDRANGNPLYATYLIRMAEALTNNDTIAPTGDIAEYLGTVPAFDQSLDAYYDWLLSGFGGDTGALWIVELLALTDFPVSADELGQILPSFRHHVGSVLSRLAPVLTQDVVYGGVRIYHESFQRYIRDRLAGNAADAVAKVLAPAIQWLDDRGFFADLRAFRSLFHLLQRARRYKEIVERVSDDFVAIAVAHGQPADAVFRNLATAGEAAAALQDWPALARLVELSREAHYLYEWRLNDHTLAEQYGRAFAALFGTKVLADRLLHDGRCTFPPRPGLQLCKLCDEDGTIPPWTEYLRAHDRQVQTENTLYGAESEAAIQVARLTGRLRLQGRERSIRDCTEWLRSPDSLPLHPGDVAYVLGEIYGIEALLKVVESLPPGTGRAWARLVLAQCLDDPERARAQAEAAMSDGLPRDGWRECLRLGATPDAFPRDPARLVDLTVKVLAPKVQFDKSILASWLTEIELAAAVGDNLALSHAEASIPPDTWFRRWLRFCVMVARPECTQDDIVDSLMDLGQDIEVFKGDPRVCDLYRLHGEIRNSFRNALSRLDDGHWCEAIKALARISTGTTTWLMGSRDGPLTPDTLFELCLETADTNAKLLAAANLASELLVEERSTSEFYDTHAEDHLLLTRVFAASGQRDRAETAWLDACKYLAGYGWRKDITVYELLDPLPKLADADPTRVRLCFRDVQPVVERILIHTDGKETRHAVHQWLDSAAAIHPEGALAYLAMDQINRVPTFGDLDHALPKALVALSGRVDPLTLAAGWLASGSEARSEPCTALTECENVMFANPDVGQAIWASVVGSLHGDGTEPLPDLGELVTESAKRVGLPVPRIEAAGPASSARVGGETGHRRGENRIQRAAPDPILPIAASPIQIVQGVRQWRSSRETRREIEGVVSAIGWRLLEMVKAGDESAAEAVVHRLARDTTWDDHEILAGLSEGFAARGVRRLAALTGTLAYTRANDGWRRFGGVNAESLFLHALDLDSSTAWSTLAHEVADGIAGGGHYGITAHLIELLVAAGRVDDAFDAWHAACRAITFRVPPTGPHDEIDVMYDHECDDSSDMIASAIVARLNHYALHEKRLAIAAAALLVRHNARSFSAALRFAVNHSAPPSTLITLLHVMERFETEPFDATHAAQQELYQIATGYLVSGRVLARHLLERAGLPAPRPSPPSLSPVVLLPGQRTEELLKGIGRLRIKPIEEILPEYGQYVAARIDMLLRSANMKERMERALRRIRSDRRGRQLQVWLPFDEEVERVLQTTGAAAGASLAQEGVFDSEVETKIGMKLLGNIETTVRRALSRVVRPTHLPPSHALAPGWSVGDPITIPDGEHAAWVVLAYHETESLIGDGYDKPIRARINVWSGVIFAKEWRDDGGLPLGYGQPDIWYYLPSRSMRPGPFRGPIAGLNIVRDPFGPVVVVTPHPIIPIVSRLMPAAFERGLMLVDSEGKPAVVCHSWRQRLIGEELADREPLLEGMQLLVRPDVFETVSAYAIEPPTRVTVVSVKNTDAE